MTIDDDLLHRIKEKKLDEVEAAWTARMESAPHDLVWFVEVARELRGAKQQAKLVELVVLLADGLATQDAWEEAFGALREGVVLLPRVRELRAKAAELARARYGDRSDLDEILAFFDVEEAEDPVRAFDRLREWLRFETGAAFWLFGRGLGKVASTNLALQKVEIRFEKAAPLVMRADEAQRLLTWIPPAHFMVRRLEDPEGVAAEAKADPGSLVHELLRGFGRPLTAAEIRECMTGVVEGARFTSWWNRAKSHPQVLPSKEKRNAFEWSESAADAERTLLSEFESATFAERLDLARKHAKRGGAVKEGILAGLREELERVAPEAEGAAEALELHFLLDELGGLPDPSPLALDDLLARADAVEIVAAVSDRRYRGRLWKRLLKVRPEDWPELYREAFLAESDLRVMSALWERLHTKGPEGAAEKIVAEVSSTPRKAPRAFVWVLRNVLAREELAGRATHGLLSKVAEALDAPEFKELKAPLREQFDEGGLAFTVFEGSDPDQADRLLTLIDSASLEEHRKTAIRRAIFRKYPKIRKRSDDDAVWATPGALETKRREFERLVKVEIPENAEAIRVAREYGDLRENFEYHAARQQHEVLNARAARLHGELKRARMIDAEAVDASKVSIGTTFELVPVAGGAPRPVTLLGPWDSDPDRGIYSHRSGFARKLADLREGDSVVLDDGEYRIARLRPWRAAAAAGR